ncbi:MAG: FAD-dependent oxidoreductase [Chloroflexi bacterium]|nr:FAD-dependent oxidoreductase [Chloroflexota bacterium]
MATAFPHLLSPIRIGNITLRNRLAMAAMGTALGEGFHPTPRSAEFYAARSRGGIGLIITHAFAVHPTTGHFLAGGDGWEEEYIPNYRLIPDAVHPHGAKVIAQLIHSGRSWAASAVVSLTPPNVSPTGDKSHAMTKREIQEIYQGFARTALNMKRAGFDGVEVHGAHGFLPQKFLSPLTNFRTDEYGGSLSNRARFALELCYAIRQAVGRDFVVGIRISADELAPGGMTLAEMASVARWLEESGDLDFIDVSQSSTGTTFSMQQADMSWAKAPFIHLAEGIKKATKGIPILGGTRITDPMLAEEIIAAGKADMVHMTRGHLADPEIALKVMQGRPEDIRPCIGCNQGCAGYVHGGLPVRCLVNPETGRELEFGPLQPAPRKRSVVVIGGGPAGMEAARVAALRGHLVALFERRDRLGGQISTLVKAPLRQEFGNFVAWQESQLKKLGVIVKLNTEATPELLREEEAEVAIVATGSVPDLPTFPAMARPGSPRLVSAEDVLEGRVQVGKRAVLLDGDGNQKAASTALFLAEHGAKVDLVTRAGILFADIPRMSRPPALQRLKDRHVAFHRDSWIKEVRGNIVVLADISSLNQDEELIEGVDLIVAVLPNAPSSQLYEILKGEGRIPQVVAVGDCASPKTAVEAVREGYMAARAI